MPWKYFDSSGMSVQVIYSFLTCHKPFLNCFIEFLEIHGDVLLNDCVNMSMAKFLYKLHLKSKVLYSLIRALAIHIRQTSKTLYFNSKDSDHAAHLKY